MGKTSIRTKPTLVRVAQVSNQSQTRWQQLGVGVEDLMCATVIIL